MPINKKLCLNFWSKETNSLTLQRSWLMSKTDSLHSTQPMYFPGFWISFFGNHYGKCWTSNFWHWYVAKYLHSTLKLCITFQPINIYHLEREDFVIFSWGFLVRLPSRQLNNICCGHMKSFSHWKVLWSQGVRLVQWNQAQLGQLAV